MEKVEVLNLEYDRYEDRDLDDPLFDNTYIREDIDEIAEISFKEEWIKCIYFNGDIVTYKDYFGTWGFPTIIKRR